MAKTKTTKTTAQEAPEATPAQAPGAEQVGGRLREERERRHIGVRELARRLGVSASLISQIELGRATPSVQTLYAIVAELDLSLDELFADPGASTRGPAGRRQQDQEQIERPQSIVVVGAKQGKSLRLASGVTWERLTPGPDPNVDFLRVTYPPGAASCEEDTLMRHAGHEYGHILTGHLTVTIGFDQHTLGPGDSISFASTTPHRLHNTTNHDVHGIWVVIGRRGDTRITTD